MAALEQIGIFYPLMMQSLNRESEQARIAICSEPCAASKNATLGAILATTLIIKFPGPTRPASKKRRGLFFTKELHFWRAYFDGKRSLPDLDANATNAKAKATL